jgi:hypothetical protein
MANVDKIVKIAEELKEAQSTAEKAQGNVDRLQERLAAEIGAPAKRSKKSPKKKKSKRGRPKGSTNKKKGKRGRPKSAKKGPAAKRGRPAAKKKSPPKKENNGMTLTKLIPEILSKKKGGMKHPQVVKAIQKKGYKTVADDFNNVVYQTLRKQVRDKLLKYDEETLKFAVA